MTPKSTFCKTGRFLPWNNASTVPHYSRNTPVISFAALPPGIEIKTSRDLSWKMRDGVFLPEEVHRSIFKSRARRLTPSRGKTNKR
ncbi:hypothetical protein CDAR_581191 [Caerostris darwini]|uniref:Ribosomal protein S19 n=1 Tax=Caerostris darwini TaxID=1538125 RepID=A0AAV4MJY9_9ARAC|nr:hypothetical protein CDAR_581191 [Caerostris darwini]